jgi:hypothetical protein
VAPAAITAKEQEAALTRLPHVGSVIRLANDLLDMILVNVSPRDLLANCVTEDDRKLDMDWHVGVTPIKMDQNGSKFNR